MHPHRLALPVVLLALPGTLACRSAERRPAAPQHAGPVREAVQPPLPDLQPGDLLVAIEGRPVRSRADAVRARHHLPPGETVELQIDRAGRRITLRSGAPR